MIALVGAMFTSVGSAQAADPKIGDVTAGYGFCAMTEEADADATPPTADEWTLVAMQRSANAAVDETGQIHVYGPDTDDDDELDMVDIPCSKDDVGKPFTVSPDGTTTPNVVEAEPTVVLLHNDRDGVVKGGTTLRVDALFLNWETADSVARVDVTADPGDGSQRSAKEAAVVEIEWVRVSGVFTAAGNEKPRTIDFRARDFATTPPTRAANYAPHGRAYAAGIHMINIPKGTPEGEYTISARIIWDTDDTDSVVTTTDQRGATCATITPPASEGADPTCGANVGVVDNDDEVLEVSTTFTVGDAGDDVGTVNLALGNEKEDNSLTTALETKAETGSAPAKGGDIWLKMSSLTSLDGPTNEGDIKSITFIAPGAELAVYDDGAFSGGRLVDDEGDLRKLSGGELGPTPKGDDNNSVQVNNPGAHTLWVKVEKEDQKPGSIDIYEIVVGDGSSKSSETVTLTFGGPAEELVLGEAASVAVGKKTEFSINAMDDGGNKAKVSQVAFSVADADGKPVPGTKVEVTQGNTGDSTDSVADDDPDEVAGIVAVGPKAEAGVYTVTVRLVGASGVTATADVVVGGKADAVALAADPETGDAADQTLIKVTATVTDKNGALVVDGTRVEFSALGRNLAPIGPGHAPIESQIQKQLVNVAGSGDDPEFEERTLTTTVGGATTKDGEVSVTFIVTGSGTATVNATTEGGSASGNLRITTSDTSAGDAMPEEEASVSCLSELSGFATWSCGVEADASEIFGMVSGRGVTAIHLWNGSTWVRYSVVDGAMVPGSSDFMVTENDILYISN